MEASLDIVIRKLLGWLFNFGISMIFQQKRLAQPYMYSKYSFWLPNPFETLPPTSLSLQLQRLEGKLDMRKRILLITLLPVTVFLWLFGWSVFWISSQRKHKSHKNRTAAKGEITQIAEPIWKEVLHNS